MLLVVPGCADPQPRSAAGEHVQRGHRLGKDARVPVGDARHEGAEPCRPGVGGQEAEGSVGLQHRFLGSANPPDLEEVVHDPDRVVAGAVGGPGDLGEGGPDLGRTARPCERRNLQSELHRPTPFAAPRRPV